jgi:DNA-binding PadR family transcriptional regulator
MPSRPPRYTTQATLDVLTALLAAPKPPSGIEISRSLGRAHTTVCRILRRLEDDGVLESLTDTAGDGRHRRYRMTAYGREQAARAVWQRTRTPRP